MSDHHDPIAHPGHGAATVLLAAASLGAAAIHLAAGPTHVEELGDIGLAFYWTAMFQIALGVGFIRASLGGPSRTLRSVALVGTLGITGMWVISRTVGLPFIDVGPESVGTADLVATVLQVGTVIILLAMRRAPAAAHGPTHGSVMRTAAPASWAARAAVVAVVAGIAMTSSIGVADATTGHVDGHGHASGAMDDHASGATDDHAASPAEDPAPGATDDHHGASPTKAPAPGATDDEAHDELGAHGHDEAPLP